MTQFKSKQYLLQRIKKYDYEGQIEVFGPKMQYKVTLIHKGKIKTSHMAKSLAGAELTVSNWLRNNKTEAK